MLAKSDWNPNPVFSKPVVLLLSDLEPKPELYPDDEFNFNASKPIAVLKFPVLVESALTPNAVFSPVLLFPLPILSPLILISVLKVAIALNVFAPAIV